LALIKNAGGPELQVLTEPPFEFGWRTGKEALLGEKRTVEEAVASRRALQDAKRTALGPAPPLPQVTKPAAPKSQLKPPGPASSDAVEMDLELAPDESQDELLDRLPLGWEKKFAAVDRTWFLADQNLFLTDLELKTYVQTMGWADSSNSGREDWPRIIVENLDTALSGAPKGKRDRLPKFPQCYPLATRTVILSRRKVLSQRLWLLMMSCPLVALGLTGLGRRKVECLESPLW
jgi:hypothetical protein